MLKQIISGGQTGVDRAALDAALQAGLPIGGWCPLGRKAEDGRIPERYPLWEMPSAEYSERTERNVLEADGTLILNWGDLTGGTRETQALAQKHRSPYLLIQLETERELSLAQTAAWIEREQIEILNVAGPRGSKSVQVYPNAYHFCERLFIHYLGHGKSP